MSRRVPILLFNLVVIAILTLTMTSVVLADGGKGHSNTGGHSSGQGGGPGNNQPSGGPGGNGPNGGQPPSDNQTAQGSHSFDGQLPSDNISDNFTGHGPRPPYGAPPSDNMTDNFTGHMRPRYGTPPSDNMTDNFTGHGPQPPDGVPPSDNMTDNFTGHGPRNWDSNDNTTSSLLQSVADILNISKQTLIDAFKQALKLNQ